MKFMSRRKRPSIHLPAEATDWGGTAAHSFCYNVCVYSINHDSSIEMRSKLGKSLLSSLSSTNVQ